MRCSELMKTDVECVSPTTSVRDAARKMRDRNIGFLPVCDDSMQPLGTITDRDIAIRGAAEELSFSAAVQNCMTREVVDCSPEDDIEHARELMEKYQVSRVMCTNSDGRVDGVISLSDIVEMDEEMGGRTLRQVSQREIRNDSMRAHSD